MLREFKLSGATRTVEKDYVYRDGVALAAVHSTGEVHHLHPDHLGSPRLITRNGGAYVAFHVYHPYGAEATAFNQDTERAKFTGHERDLGQTSSAADDLDYMHDRYFNKTTGRFIAVDRLRSWEPLQPQTWNRYAYAKSNPLRYIDPDGQKERSGFSAGLVINQSNQTIWIAGDVPELGVVSIPLEAGEKSSDFFADADAVIVGPGQTISGETGGAFKVGPFSLTVRGNEASSLSAGGSFLYYLGVMVGSSGHSEPPADAQWVVPPDTKAAKKLKESIRKVEPTPKTPKNTISIEKIKLPSGRLLRLVQNSQNRADPFRGTGFCSADNVCH